MPHSYRNGKISLDILRHRIERKTSSISSSWSIHRLKILNGRITDIFFASSVGDKFLDPICKHNRKLTFRNSLKIQNQHYFFNDQLHENSSRPATSVEAVNQNIVKSTTLHTDQNSVASVIRSSHKISHSAIIFCSIDQHFIVHLHGVKFGVRPTKCPPFFFYRLGHLNVFPIFCWISNHWNLLLLPFKDLLALLSSWDSKSSIP